MLGPDKNKFPFERKAIARQVREARRLERAEHGTEGKYEADRSGLEYLCRMGGLRHYFEYLATLSSKKVLDIGAGTGRSSELLVPMAKEAGLDLHATVLTSPKSPHSALEKGHVHITSAEVLRGIEEGSLAGVMGVNSIAYTLPKISIPRIDSALVPGGALKAVFRSFKKPEYDTGSFKDPFDFIAALARLRYDVAFRDHEFLQRKHNSVLELMAGKVEITINAVILAIKPGNPNAPKAETLLEQDLEELPKLSEGKAYGMDMYNTDS